MDATLSLHSLERSIVKHAAPTLAGIKPASLFTCPEPFERLERDLALCRSRLAAESVSVDALAKRQRSTLLLVSRKTLMQQTLECDRTQDFLRSEGYEPECLTSCLACLRERIARFDRAPCASCSFPHEIGLFLGYPFEDVMAFIRKDAECVVCGLWRAYGNEEATRAQFERYRACTARLTALFDEGTPLERLASLGTAA